MDNLDDINSVEDLLKAQLPLSEDENNLTEEEQRAFDICAGLLDEDWQIRVLICRGLIGNLSETFKEVAGKIVSEDPKAAIGLLYDGAQMDVALGIMRGVGGLD